MFPKNIEKESIHINIDFEDVVENDIDSKLWWDPYWPEWKKYPENIFWVHLRFIAQINFSQLPKNDIFPTHWILQFFIDSTDEDMWCEFWSLENTGGYKVVYHKQVEQNIWDDIIFNYIWKEKNNPLEYSELSFPIKFQYVTNDIPWYNCIENDEFEDDEKLFEYLDSHYKWTKLLWYPAFAQNDIRRDIKNWEDYILLLQLDSYYLQDMLTIWDSWIMNFFIHKNDLKNLNFDNVIYNWDCA